MLKSGYPMIMQILLHDIHSHSKEGADCIVYSCLKGKLLFVLIPGVLRGFYLYNSNSSYNINDIILFNFHKFWRYEKFEHPIYCINIILIWISERKIVNISKVEKQIY